MNDENDQSSSSEPMPISPDPILIESPEAGPDTRLYVPEQADWNVQIKRNSERIYCFSKLPGQDWFHLILHGEIYVSRQTECYCLRCALRLNFLTQDRLFWQHRVAKKPGRVL